MKIKKKQNLYIAHPIMNKLIWINEKELNNEFKILKKIKPEIEFNDILSFLNFNKKPIFWGDYDIIINWSFEQNKVEFFLTEKYINWFCNYYFFLIYYNELGDLKEKSIIFMELESENKKIKNKKPFKIKEILFFMKKNKRIKLSIYFEIIIKECIEKESYFELNNIGGLYDVINNSWNNFKICKLIEWKFYKKKINIEKYKDWEDLIKISEESLNTVEDMKKNKLKWELFKPTL